MCYVIDEYQQNCHEWQLCFALSSSDLWRSNTAVNIGVSFCISLFNVNLVTQRCVALGVFSLQSLLFIPVRPVLVLSLYTSSGFE